MGGISAMIKENQIDEIEKAGGYYGDGCVIVPRDGKMLLIRSDDGQIMIDGEGFQSVSPAYARRIIADYADQGFEWVERHYFHTMEMTTAASQQDINLCNELGYDIYKNRMSPDGWAVLRSHDGDPIRPYVAGHLAKGKLTIVGRDYRARIPEEAVGFCYCSKVWGQLPRSAYALHTTRKKSSAARSAAHSAVI